MRYGQKRSFGVRLTELAEPARAAATGNRPTERPTANAGPAAIKNDALGISMGSVPAELATRANLAANKRGVMVTDVVPLGPSYNKLGEQDVIFEVLYPAPRRPIRSTADLQAVLNSLKDGDYVSLNVHSLAQGGGGDRVVNIRLGN
jgi:S1-C subfamily serine protease